MNNEYQAIYDAISLQAQGLSFAIECVRNDYQYAAARAHDPHVLMRPKIFKDGNEWCALYGDNLQDGVAGFGKSPALAMQDFDKNWNAQEATNEQN